MPNIPSRPVGGRRIAAGVALSLAAVLVLAGFVGEVVYGAAYGTLAFWSVPPQISWCGRTYLPSTGPALSLAAVQQQRAALPGDQPYPVVQVARIPPLVGRRLLASVTPQASRDRLNVPCAMVVYLETDPDSYRPYELSGGP
jgi:hypothetical protein